MGHQHSDETKDRFIYEARLVRVVDGDTIDVNVDLGFKIYHKIRLRLLGIDTPEIRGVEKVAGKVSKEAIIDLLGFADKRLFIETEKKGKYGRYIATIWLPIEYVEEEQLDNAYIETFNGEEWLNVNEYMVFHKFAKRYGES